MPRKSTESSLLVVQIPSGRSFNSTRSASRLSGGMIVAGQMAAQLGAQVLALQNIS